MNERRRLEYLQVMGITQFVPRFMLPAARASALLPPTEEPSAEAAPATVVSSENFRATERPVANTPAAPPVTRALAGVVDGLMDVLAPERPPATEPEGRPDTPPALTAPTPFALSIWRASPALMVVDSRYAAQALPTQTLLQNMLLAKGVADFGQKPDVLQWPPIAGARNLGDWAAAQEMVLAFLQARLERQPVQYLWLMGDNAMRAVAPAGKSYGNTLGQALNLDTLGALAVVLPSLADMLLNPALKAVAWRAIRAHHVG